MTAAALAAALVVAKVFLTSAVVWLVVTRRLRLLALATVLAAAALLGSWAVIGFAGFRGYPHLLATLARAEQALSYSPLALGLDLGLRAAVARAAVAVLAAALLLACLRRRREDGRAFAWGILAALALSPIVWPHYCVVLFPVLGILRPRFDRVWLIPLASWLAVHPHSTGALETAVGIGVAAVTLLAAVRVPRLAPLREPLLEQS